MDVVRTKLAGFAIGAFIAGLAGALLAYKNTRVSFESYNVLTGLLLFAIAYVSGIASIAGGLITGLLATGGLVYVLVDRSVALGSWYSVVTAVALILVVILQPQGIAGALRSATARVRRGRRRRIELDERSTPADVSEHPPPDPEARPARKGAGSEVLLSVSHLGVRYSGIAALSDVDLEVRRGSITGLIGPNGAGKTTLLDALGGLTPASGTVLFDDAPLVGPPHTRARRGLARTFQGLDLYDQLTVAENTRSARTWPRITTTRTGGSTRYLPTSA